MLCERSIQSGEHICEGVKGTGEEESDSDLGRNVTLRLKVDTAEVLLALGMLFFCEAKKELRVLCNINQSILTVLNERNEQHWARYP